MNYNGWMDKRSIGRFAPRESSTDGQFLVDVSERRRGDEPLLYFFDGKSITPVNRRGSSGDLDYFTGMGTAAPLRQGKLPHADWGYAYAAVQSEYAFRCVNIVAEDVAGIKHGVRDKRTKQDLPDHPLMQAIRYARTEYKQDIIALWQKSKRIWGETYILPVRNAFGICVAARWLNPLATEPVTLSGQLDYFEYSAGGSLVRYWPHEMVYDKNDSWLDDLRGQSLIGVALDAINIDREVKRFTLDRFLKDMKWAGIITGRQGSDVQMHEGDALLAMLKEQKDSRLIFLPQAVEFQRVQQDLDNSHLGVSEDVRRRITTALGIPMSTAGAWDDAKYQSAPAQMLFYYEQVIFRECERHAQFTNDVWLPYYDDSGTAEYYYDTSQVQAKLEDKKLKTEIVTMRVQGATMTINEAREQLGDKPIDGGDTLLIPSGYTPIHVTRLAQMTSAAPMQPLLPDGTPTAPSTAMDAVTPPAEPTAQPGTKSVAAILSIGANTDLVAFQQSLRQHFADLQVTWNEPDTFHVTLAHAPSATDEQIAALVTVLEAIELPDELPIRVGSLNTFDALTQWTLHFRVPRNTALNDLQAEVYEAFDGTGIAVRSHHRPETFKPHITMGYSEDKPGTLTFNSRVTVKPHELQLTVGDEHTIAFRRAFGAEPNPPPTEPTVKSHDHNHDVRAMLHNPPHEDALSELAAWNAKVKARGKSDAAFKTYWIRPEIADSIQAALHEAGDDREAVKAVFANARAWLSVKAVQATRIDFEDAFADALQSALDGRMTKRQWSAKVRSLINTYGNRAFRDGLAEGGVDDPPSEEEMDTIARLLSEQSAYVTNLANTLFADETTVSPAMAEQKPALWWNGSIVKFYNEGRLAADANGMYEWVLGATEEHCGTCARLDGQRKRYKTWYRLNLIAGTTGQDTDCEGWRCECRLVRVAGKATIIHLELLEAAA